MLIVITGASKGIGFEMVQEFAREKKHTVVAVSRSTTSLTKLVTTQKQNNIVIVKADITNANARKKIAACIKTLGLPVNVLINNAGLLVNKAFEKITDKELEAVYATNVFAPFLLIQSLLPMFDKKGNSHIVNISSMGGFQGSAKFPGLSAYSSSKTALSGLTECLAEELKPKNIAVNCLAIGAVQTEMLSKAFPGYKASLQPNEMAAYICNFALNGRRYFNGKILPVSSTTP